MQNLKDTIKLMVSDNWEDRLKAEYWQLKIRMERLDHTIKLGIFEGDMNDTMIEQYKAMKMYLKTIEHRAELCKIKL